MSEHVIWNIVNFQARYATLVINFLEKPVSSELNSDVLEHMIDLIS